FGQPGVEAEAVRSDVLAALGPRARALSVRTWKEVLPDLAALFGMADAYDLILYFVMYFLAALGILNAQRMSALERRREFGVMLAIGVTPARLARLLLVETVTLTGVGAALGALWGGALATYHSIHPLDISGGRATQDGFSYLGLTLDYQVRFHFHWDMVVEPVLVIGLVGLLCGMWPAIRSARLDIVRAISGRT
ncbi:MAG: ABC transporter permease, partial [Deltaproteobacteria bacterium]